MTNFSSRSLFLAAGTCLPALALAQQALQPVVITAAPADTQRWTAPASIDVVDGEELRAGQLQVNLSEGLGRVPGLTIQNRQNYAQDLQLSIRGFGARSTFGVRGVRLYVDGIPASAPDGQGQTANFPLGNAQRIEVIRGPYAVLYGNASGGVVSLYTADGQATEWRAGVAAGADGLWRASTQANGVVGGYSYSVDAEAFGTKGLRPQSTADRDTGHAKLSRSWGDGRLVLIANRQVSQAQDPLGLSRAEFDANPYQTTPSATQYNTRKTIQQTQLGLSWQQRLGGGQQLELMGYGGQRGILQYQAIPAGTQAAAASPGGIISLQRDFWGLNARWRLERSYASGKLMASLGLATDRQDEQRQGYDNFSGTATVPTALGVQGRLRRDEHNQASTLDPYAQLEWSSTGWTLSGGVRRTRVRLTSADHYIVPPGNGDDSGAVEYSATLPVIGLRLLLSPKVQAYASVGRGLESPTLNEVAYRAFGTTGLNTALNASRSHSAELGLRGRFGWASWSGTLFDVATEQEIVVLTNTGGRSTFQNAGRTRRRGLELAGDAQWGAWQLTAAATLLDARYSDSFSTCNAAPCTAPNLLIPAGNRLPGMARLQTYASLAWDPQWAGSTLTAEIRRSSAVAVNDRNSDAAPAYTVLNLAWRFRQGMGAWQWSEFVRVDNLADRRYAGSVIVNEGNGRYFESAQGRALAVGLELLRRFD